MAEMIEMLALSPTMEEGTLVSWKKNEGETVEEGEIIAEIETDKAAMDMESFFSGTVLKVFVKEGDAIPVGAPMAIIGEPGEDISDLLAEAGGGGAAPKEAAPAEAAAPAETQKEAPAKKESVVGTVGHVDSSSSGRIFASPLARKIAAEKGLDLAQIAGSGPSGRIVKADVESVAPSKAAIATEVMDVVELAEKTGESGQLSQMRKTIAKRLTSAWNEVPHFFLTMTVDMAQAMKLRKTLNQGLADAGFAAKISVNDFIIKACGLALVQYPNMNRSFRGDHFVAFDTADIGVAVAIEDGLITPVIRGVESKSLSAISSSVRELAARAREKKLKPEEYTGSSFSISNLGMYGIDQFTAIINPPEAGILACGAVQKVPVVSPEGEIVVGTQMKLTLSCDHRIVDGATGAEFLALVKKYLEAPMLMLA